VNCNRLWCIELWTAINFHLEHRTCENITILTSSIVTDNLVSHAHHTHTHTHIFISAVTQQAVTTDTTGSGIRMFDTGYDPESVAFTRYLHNISVSSFEEEVQVTLQLTVRQSVCLGVQPPSGTHNQKHV
jgi:hypothetical protein